MGTSVAFASESLLRNAIRAGRAGGSTFDYFTEHGWWEARDRSRFEELWGRAKPNTPEFESGALPLLRKLNGTYKTRCSGQSLPEVNRCLIREVDNFSRSHPAGLGLLLSTDEERESLGDLLVRTMQTIKNAGFSRPYSLATKFLHFMLPNTFAIYDSQAARTIDAWWGSVCSGDAHTKFGVRRPFGFARIADTSASGYRSVLDFYWLIWQASPAEVWHEADQVARMLQDRLRSEFSGPLARVNVLDLIDKYLWRASGHSEAPTDS